MCCAVASFAVQPRCLSRGTAYGLSQAQAALIYWIGFMLVLFGFEDGQHFAKTL